MIFQNDTEGGDSNELRTSGQHLKVSQKTDLPLVFLQIANHEQFYCQFLQSLFFNVLVSKQKLYLFSEIQHMRCERQTQADLSSPTHVMWHSKMAAKVTAISGNLQKEVPET